MKELEIGIIMKLSFLNTQWYS